MTAKPPTEECVYGDIMKVLKADNPGVPRSIIRAEARWQFCRWIWLRFRRGERLSDMAKERGISSPALYVYKEDGADGGPGPLEDYLQQVSDRRAA